jgi:hypothetical protein
MYRDAYKLGNDLGQTDVIEDAAAAVAKATRILGATIGTDAENDPEELVQTLAYCEAILVHLHTITMPSPICDHCLATSLVSDDETRCDECSNPLHEMYPQP